VFKTNILFLLNRMWGFTEAVSLSALW